MLTIIIPAYEPDNKMLALIDSLEANSDLNKDMKILIINDGSSREYEHIFTKAVKKGCIKLTHEKNLGKGAALKTAFSYLLESGYKGSVVCADCDGQHRPEDIKKVASSLPDSTKSLVLGCRDFVGKVPLKSRFGNSLTGAVYSLISGQKLKDTQTGLRAFSSELLPWLISIKGSRYEYEMNQLLEAKAAHVTLCCVPIETIYENKNSGSHFHPVRDSIRIYMPILKYLMSSLMAGVIDFVLLFLFMKLSDSLLFSVIAARVISSAANFFCNKILVFERKEVSLKESLVKYYLLAAFILLCNYTLMYFFTNMLHIPLLAGKILTEVVLFFFSYQIQRLYIFRKEYA